MVKIIFSSLILAAAPSCGRVVAHSEIDRPASVNYASVGNVILHVDKKEDLPNAFGNADIFGRKRDRGFTDIRYLGLDTAGHPVFRRRDVDIYSNETTMSRSGAQFSTATAYQNGNSITTSGFFTSTPPATVQPLPPDTTEFVINQGPGGRATVADHGIEILSIDNSGIGYRVW